MTFKKQLGYNEDQYYPKMSNKQTFDGVTIDQDLLSRILLHKYKQKMFSNEFMATNNQKNQNDL